MYTLQYKAGNAWETPGTRRDCTFESEEAADDAGDNLRETCPEYRECEMRVVDADGDVVTTWDAVSPTTHTYTIFDADPNTSGACSWDDHQDVEILADDADDARSQVEHILESVASECNPSDGYEVGQRIYAIVWDEDGAIVAKLSYELTAEDLGV